MRKLSIAISAFALLLVCTAPSRALDNEDAAASAPRLEEVRVTAQKRSESLQDVPLAVSVINGNALTDHAVQNLLDLQGEVPNTTLEQRLSSGVVTIRGIGFDIITAGANSSVAVNTDGVYISRPPVALTGLYDINRIEVMRGPQSTLYGRNSTGGAINIVTNRPTADTEGYVDVGLGNHDAVSLEGALGGSLIGDTLLGRIAVKTDDHGGYGTNLFNDRSIDNLHTRAGRAELLLNATDKINFLLVTDFFWESDSNFALHYLGPYTPDCAGSGGVAKLVCPAAHGFVAPRDPFDVDQDVQTTNERRFYGTRLTSSFDLDWAKLLAITAARHTHSDYLGDLDGTSDPLAAQGITRLEDANQFSQEIQLSGDAARLQWLLGLYYFNETDFARATGYFAYPVPAPLVGPFFQGANLTTDAYAVFAQGTYHFTDTLSVTAGGRFSDETHRIANEQLKLGVTDIFRATLSLPDQVTFDAFTPRISLEYKYDQNGLAYVTIQKGFKSGGFAAGSVSPPFEPETIWDYEVGIKSTWLQNRLLTNFAAFHYDYRNLQQGIVAGTSTIIGNVPKAKDDGFEFESKALLGHHFSVDVNGGYLDARFGTYSTIDTGRNNTSFVLDGNSLSQAPRFSGTLGAQYVLPVGRGDLTFRGEVYGSSRVYFTPFNVPINSQGGYALENAFITWDELQGLPSVSIYVKNIADRAVVAGSFVSAAFVGAAVDASLLPPRTFGVDFRWKH